jgi:hypothetical protein
MAIPFLKCSKHGMVKYRVVHECEICAAENRCTQPTDNQHTQLAIAALRGALSRLPVNLGMVDQILVAFEEELQQQASA